MSLNPSERVAVRRDRGDAYARDAATAGAEFARERTGAELEHVGSYSFDPALAAGNVERFVGVARGRGRPRSSG